MCKLQPKNKDAAKKAKEVEKIIKELAFQAAIGVDDKSAFDELDPESITVEGSYDGPHLPTPLTAEAIEEMKEKFKDGKKLHRKYLVALLIRAKEVLTEKASMVDLSVPEGAHLTVCGDTHGQFFDLCNIFTLNGAPAADNPYLFNGDFVDRGSWSVEVLVTLLAYMVLDPTSCHLNRGNHETLNMNRVYGFTGEVAAKFTGNKTMGLFTEVFCALPLAHCAAAAVAAVAAAAGVAGAAPLIISRGDSTSVAARTCKQAGVRAPRRTNCASRTATIATHTMPSGGTR